MGQELCKAHLDIDKTLENNFSTTLPDDIKDDISYFFPLKYSSNSQELNNNRQEISSFQQEYIKQIQNSLLLLTKSNQWEQVNKQIDEKFIENISTHISEQSQNITDEQNNSLGYQQQLQTSLTNKINQDKNPNISIFTSILTDSSSEDPQQQRNTQLSYFAVQALISILLILIKSAEKSDPTITQQVLTLANQLCGQLPVKSLSSLHSFLLQSLKPLIDYIQTLSLSTDSNLSKQSIEILLSLSIAKGSLNDLLPLLKNLIFNTTDIYNLQGLLTQMNNYLTETINKSNNEEKTELTSLNYLKSIDVYPNIQANKDLFTGQFLSSIILSHIDIDNQLNPSSSEPPNLTSLSYELHPNTFKDLFNIIQQLSSLSNDTKKHILTICLRLFRKHLHLLSELKTDLSDDLINYVNENELKIWFDLLFKLSSNSEISPETVKEASKALIYVIHLQTSSVKEKLTLYSQYLIENKYPILINKIFLELNKPNLLSNWIDLLSADENKDFQVLYSLIDLYFTEQRSEIQNILFSFQYVLLSRFDIQDQTTTTSTDNHRQLSSLAIAYLTYIFKKYVNETTPINDLFNSILLGLCVITNTEKRFPYEFLQPIFFSILPFLTEYYLKQPTNQYLLCLIGKISHVLINGFSQDPLELKHFNKLNFPIFAGGYIQNKKDDLFNSNLASYTNYQFVDDQEIDQDLLMSIYNNTSQGAQLISNLKSFSKTKQQLLQKSIEEQVHQAIPQLFAVYLKHYRRINLAKLALLQTDQTMPYNELLSLYEYASHIQSVFSTVKGQGGDCDELSKQIQLRTSFLLLSIKESELIPLVNEDTPPTPIEQKQKKSFNYQRQHSHWTKAKHILKVLQNLFQACIRFKKLMLMKKRLNEVNYDNETLLNRSIENFLYGNFYKPSAIITNDDDQQFEIDELEKCLYRQYQRALIRVITYRFNKTFIENLLNLENKQQLLAIYLPYLRDNNIDWSYFNQIQSSNIQLKTDISTTYYSIIKQVLSVPDLIEHIFNLLNLSYQSIDLSNLSQEKLPEILFTNYVSLTSNNSLLSLKFLSFNWLQLFLFKLCEHVQIDSLQNTSNHLLLKQLKFIFNSLIFNEIQSFRDKLGEMTEAENENSLKNLTLSWFLQSNESIQLALNRYLVLLLRSMHFYKHISSVCATIDYLQEFLYIYYHTKSNVTQLLVIKCLRCIIPSIRNDSGDIAKNLLDKFLFDILNTIGQQTHSEEILSELIYLYRTILSIDSLWHILAKEFLAHSLKSHLNLQSIENNQENLMNQLLATLCILGGFIESIRLGSMVKIQTNEDYVLGLIIDINQTDKSYSIQYLETNQIESFPLNKLQLEIDVLPVNLQDYTEKILDVLGNFLQNDTSNNSSLILLEIRRRAISVLSYLLNDKKTIELFMSKPYASILANSSKSNIYPADLRVFNKQHLEQYYLSLDKTQRTENSSESASTNEKTNSSAANSNMKKINPNPLVIQSLSRSYYEWKPYASEDEVAIYKQGRVGAEEISIVSLPRHIADPEAIQECGNKHKYRGCIVPTIDNTRDDFPTFMVENLRLNQGKWYYCVRLPQAGLVQIGWATDGTTPGTNRGVGDDKYSWSYDGSRAVLFYIDGFYGQFDGYIWKENDIIGCGIDIDGNKTNIKYWLNGKFLGMGFAHDVSIPRADVLCNLLPNGPNTTYFPAISLHRARVPAELIVSPEDMADCPLPYGYRPLIAPKVIQIEHTIVDYPYHAYLMGQNSDDYFVRKSSSSMNILRDFINDKHLETDFTVDNNYLLLPENSDGLFLSLDNDNTISFDYQITANDNEKSEFVLAKCNSMEISWPKTDQTQQCVVIVLSKDQPIKVYVNNQCQTYEVIEQFNLHLLPRISAQIKDLVVWNYSLTEEQISRLFSYGLFYIAQDYQQMKEYRKRINTISFSRNQQQFNNEFLFPFNEPFTEDLWTQKKKQVDDNEPKYFKSQENEDYSTVELCGHKTYLVLEKPIEDWSNYSIQLDLSIPQCPSKNERLTIMTLTSTSEIYITSDGKLCLNTDDRPKESEVPITLNEYFQLFITLENRFLRIYVNKNLIINRENFQDRFRIESNHIDLFKQIKNSTNDDTLLVSFKSVTYLNRSLPIDQVESPSLIVPPLEIIGSSLIAMGYKKHWIESLINQNQIKNISSILHQQKDELSKKDFDDEQKRYLTILSRINPSIHPEILSDLIKSVKFDTNEQIRNTAEYFSTYLLISQSMDDVSVSEPIEDLSIPQNLNEWLLNITSTTNDDNIYQLFDINEVTKKKTTESIEYTHENLSSETLQQARLTCEQGLITMYARTTIINMFKIYSYDQSNIFPLEKFNDYSIIKLLDSNKFDQINSIIKSILKKEFQHLSDQNQIPLFNYLQNDIVIQLTQIVLKPSLLNQMDVNFLLKILNIFVELLSDKSLRIQDQFALVFPISLINLLFDLFLLNSTYQIKLLIAYLFNSLLRLTDTFLLPNRIQQFFLQLLIVLATNADTSRKKLQLALTDMIYLLLTKEDNQIKEFQSALPENIQDLFLTMNVIDTWLDSTKQKSLPEKFLEQSSSLLGEDYRLNQDDYQKSNQVFNINADKELMTYMNSILFSDKPFTELIEKLPKESQPDTTFYKNYLLLSNIPADCVHNRTRLIYLLNIFLRTKFSAVDLTLTPEQSFLADQIRRMKLYLLISTKRNLYADCLQKTYIPNRKEYLNVNFDTVKASTENTKPENTMFYQAYLQLHSNAHIEFRRPNDHVWQAQYIGMHSTDAGGPYRDSVTRICSDICSTRLPLFILCPNGRTNSALNRDCWIPNVFPPNKSIPYKYQKQYRFIGQLMGMAIFHLHYLNIKFPTLLWKRLLNEELTIEDIEAIDVQSFAIINEIEKNIEQITSFETDQDINSVFSSIMSDLHFDVVSSSGQTYELIYGGKDISITAENFKQYSSLYRQYRLNEFNRQIEFIQQGLFSIAPPYYLGLFTANEVEELVCGKSQIDIEMLKRNTNYGGYFTSTSPSIQRFWTVMTDMFTDEQRKQFLIFVWGRSTLPMRDKDFEPKFTINSYADYGGGDVDKILPRSHTCYFTIDLPAYATEEIMYERLNYAITSCASIDADGMPTNEANLDQLHLDDDNDT